MTAITECRELTTNHVMSEEELIARYGVRVISFDGPKQHRISRLLGFNPLSAEEIIDKEERVAAKDDDCLRPRLPGLDILPVPGVSSKYGGRGNVFIKTGQGLVEVTGCFENGQLLYLVPPDPDAQKISW